MRFNSVYHQGYEVQSEASLYLDDNQIGLIIENIKSSKSYTVQQTTPLSGRGMVEIFEIPGIGKVSLKRYLRGGVLGKINWGFHLSLGGNRARHEFIMLNRAKRAGLSVPEPIATVSQGSVLYRSWLLTRLIPDCKSLVEVALHEGERLKLISPCLEEMFAALISHGIRHIDLHPGNVLCDVNSKLHVLDFDKSRLFRGDPNQLRDAYLFRWRRAVLKHHLPDQLLEIVSAPLRRNYSKSLE